MLAADEEQATKDEDEHTANQSLAESARSARDMQAAITDVSTTSTSPGLLVCFVACSSPISSHAAIVHAYFAEFQSSVLL
jgi:hypothetical protein